jgi:glycosyltransferase involved in cell wall biosynthesis
VRRYGNGDEYRGGWKDGKKSGHGSINFADKSWIDGFAGVVAKSRNPQHLAKQITTLLENKELMVKMGQNGYDYSQKNLNWKDIAKDYYDIFKKYL